jgi:hypothetical protein
MDAARALTANLPEIRPIKPAQQKISKDFVRWPPLIS